MGPVPFDLLSQCLGQAAAETEQEGQDKCGHGCLGVARHIGHQQSPLPAGGQVDVVEASTGLANDLQRGLRRMQREGRVNRGGIVTLTLTMTVTVTVVAPAGERSEPR